MPLIDGVRFQRAESKNLLLGKKCSILLLREVVFFKSIWQGVHAAAGGFFSFELARVREERKQVRCSKPLFDADTMLCGCL